jgi:hypothetical protein
MMLPESARLALAQRRQRLVADHIISRGIYTGPPTWRGSEGHDQGLEQEEAVSIEDGGQAAHDDDGPLTEAEWLIICDAMGVAVHVLMLLLMAWWLMKLGTWSWVV